jgi:transposase
MLTLEERFMIKEMYRKGISISEIARRTGRDRKTIRQMVTAPLVAAAKARKMQPRKIDPYVPYLESRINDGVLNARKLYGEIRAQGYPGGESQVREWVHPYRDLPESRATARFETAPGEQGQVDWGHFGSIVHAGRTYWLYGFVMTLGWSRAMYVSFTVSSDTAWFIRCHLQAFAYFGGMPERLLYDNLKSVVLKRQVDGTIQWNPRFLDFADVVGFSPQLCRPYRPQTKGKVENGVKYVRNNFWLGLHFRDLEDINTQALTWLNTVANRRIHGTTGEVPFERLPREGLRPLAHLRPIDTSVITTRRASRDCLISFEGNMYSVPVVHATQALLVKATEQGELLIFTPQGQEVARHRLLAGMHQQSIQREHFAELQARPRKPGRPRAIQHLLEAEDRQRFWGAPVVEVRSLRVYEQVLQEERV